MKAISLWQPWASLIAIGAKHYETRHWSTRYRGPLVICSAKRPAVSRWDLDQEVAHAIEVELLGAGRFWNQLPLGRALCIVELVEVYCTDDIRRSLDHIELAFGDYSDGRYAWELRPLHMDLVPQPVKGRQGLFNIECPWPEAA